MPDCIRMRFAHNGQPGTTGAQDNAVAVLF